MPTGRLPAHRFLFHIQQVCVLSQNRIINQSFLRRMYVHVQQFTKISL